MRHFGILTALLSTAAIIGTTAAGSAWPVAPNAPAHHDPLVLAQMGGMGGGGMGGMGGGGMGGGGMGGGGMGGMGGGGMGGMGGMGGGGMGGMGGGGMGGMGGGGMGGGGMGGMGGGGMGGGGMGGMGGMGGGGGMGGMGGNVNINRNVYVRGVRPWSNRAWYGTAVAGVTLGTIIAVTAVPPVPQDGLCWFWIDASETRGYWDWCIPPN
ncbi:MAG: hypothetical protein AB7V13_18040 [Pseudorhodoplanes sp.]|uniref:hypothetical protein n=1 Tax=Pseudorhodoplanes sp. TaxID=1934341 RepID=UPI003D0B3C31